MILAIDRGSLTLSIRSYIQSVLFMLWAGNHLWQYKTMNRILLVLLMVPCFAIAQSLPKYLPFPDAQKMFSEFEKGIPQRGLVPNENAARIIGKAVLEAEFGASRVAQYGPLEVYQERGKWIIQNHVSDPAPIAFGYMVVISQHDGRIIYLTQGR